MFMMWPCVRRILSLGSLLAVGLIVIPGSFAQSSGLPVVPNASGFGMTTRAAYGGAADPTIFRVTNLNDRGPGSFREALEATVPRVVIFEISGTIALQSPIAVRAPYLTVAGQTAPSPGITVRNYEVEIYAHDVLLQHFRARTGAQPGGVAADNVPIYLSNPSNVVLDHMSISWSAHVNLGLTGTNVTAWQCFVTEGLSPFDLRTPWRGLAVEC